MQRWWRQQQYVQYSASSLYRLATQQQTKKKHGWSNDSNRQTDANKQQHPVSGPDETLRSEKRERRECKQRVNVYYHGRSLLFRIHDKGLGLALFRCYSSDAILSCRMRKNKSRLTLFFLFSFFLFNSRVSRMEAGTWREKSGRTVQARGWKQSGYDLYLLCQAARVGEQTKPACPFFFLFLLFSNLRHERYVSMCNLKDRVALTFPMRQGKFD